MLRAVGCFGRFGMVMILLVKVMMKFVFNFGINLWMVILKFLGVLSVFGLFEKLYWVLVI